MKSVILNGKRVIIAGFVSPGEVDSVRKAIKSSWPCCSRSINYKPDLAAVMITTPTLVLAQEILEAMRQLFVPITA